MTWGKSALLTIPLLLSGIFVVASPAAAQEFSDTDWTSVSAGGAHACGTDTAGYLYCWGNDDQGQLGNSEALNSKTTPNRVGDSRGWTVVSAGGSHTCGIRSSKLYCWGNDSYGQLGNGAVTGVKATPQTITAANDWTTVSAGAAHTCAVRSSGKLYCWGNDGNGRLGNGDGGSTTAPAKITAANDWKTVSAGSTHTCATRGKLYCWGNDSYGQLGNGTGGSTTVPTQITTATDWKTVSAGASHTCATRGKLHCWGNDGSGQLGNGTGGSTTAPTQITTATDWQSVSAGGSHTCAIRGTGTLSCWGGNQFGQTVASSEEAKYTTPQLYPGSWKAQDTGDRETCAIEGNGQMSCWGTPQAPPDCPAPGANVYADDPWQDLGYWKLTTPIDGTDSGDSADEVKQPALKTLDNKDYFDRRSDGSILFRARVDGATTSGSSFPRSELREMTQDGQYNRAAWSSKVRNASDDHHPGDHRAAGPERPRRSRRRRSDPRRRC